MPLHRDTVPRRRSTHLVTAVVLVTTLALVACGGSSSKATEQTASSASTSQATTAPSTQAAGQTTSAATSGSTAAATSTATATVAAASTTASSSGTSVPISSSSSFQKVVDAWKALKSYKMTVTFYNNGATTPSGNATVETETPDKSHWVLNENGQKIEIITIGTSSYINLAGTWTKSPVGVPSSLPPIGNDNLTSAMETPAATPGDITAKGTDDVNGKTCDVYEVKSPDGTTDSTFCVGQKDNLPYKISVTSDNNRSDIVISDFNADFNIQPPI